MQTTGTSPEEQRPSNASEPAAEPALALARAEVVSNRGRTTFAAFISFRHAEPDRNWAKWLHSSLERYRLPKRLARQRGLTDRVGRIFRDEEELSASSDLSTSIREALESSEYLIVVCSPRTPQSEWVNAEVEYFRSLGRSDRILALLIEGEPSEAFPKALRETQQLVLAKGESRHELETLEPLAADVRENKIDSRRFRKRMAKLRLLAAILGCRFDDLRQREQEHRTRILAYAVVFLAVLGSTISGLGFFAEVNRRTAVAERDRALRNQSMLLANFSNQQTARGDATTGILLALEALPHDLSRPERPYVGKAETALYQALYARRELAVLRQTSPIKVASVSAGGGRVLTVSEDGRAQLWDGINGAEVATLRGGDAPIRKAEFSPDAARILTVPKEGAARLWNAVDGAELAILGEGERTVRDALFSPDGAQILTTSNDDVVRLWDAMDGEERAILRGHEAPVGMAVFNADGTRVLTASDDGTARLWDTRTAGEIAVLRVHSAQAKFFDELNRILMQVSLRDRGPFQRLFDMYTRLGNTMRVRQAVFSPDGTRVLTASISGDVRIWDAGSGRELISLRQGWDLLPGATFSPDGTRILTASILGSAVLWDAASGRQLAVFGTLGREIWRAILSPDGKRVVTAYDLEGRALLWDTASGQQLASLGKEASVRMSLFSPDGTRLVTGTGGDGAHLWDSASGRKIATLKHDAPTSGSHYGFSHSGTVDSLAFSRDGALVLTAGQDGAARVWDAVNGNELAVLRGHEAPVRTAVFSSNGTRVVTVSDDGTARLWDARAGAEVKILRTQAMPIRRAAFSPDGAQILTTSNDDVARLWDAIDGKESAILRGHEAPVGMGVFSADGTRVLTASEDGTARLWDARTAAEVAVLRGHTSRVSEAVFSPDGTRVLTTSKDRTARVWNATDGRELAVLRHDSEMYSGATFSPDAARIVTIAADPKRPGSPSAHLWDIASGRRLAVLSDGHIDKAIFSPDGTRVLTTAAHGDRARLWDAANGAEVMALPKHEDYVVDPAFTPDGQRILTVAYDEVARLWDRTSGKELSVLRQDIGVRHAFVSPDGSKVLTLSSGIEPPRLWDLASGRQLGVLRGHDHSIQLGVFSPDSAHVVTYSSGDGTACLWDAASGRQLSVIHRDRIEHVAFAPDSSRVMILSKAGTVRIFPVFSDIRALVAHALRVVPRRLSAKDRERYSLETN